MKNKTSKSLPKYDINAVDIASVGNGTLVGIKPYNSKTIKSSRKN